MQGFKRVFELIYRRLDPLFQYYDWVVLALLTVIILLPKFPLLEVNGTYVHIRMEDFLVATVYAIWLIGVYGGRFRPQLVYKFRALVFFIIYGLGITLLGIGFFGTIPEPFLGILHWLRRVEYLGMYFIAATVCRPERLRIYLIALIGVGVLTVVYAFFQFYDLVPGVFTLSRPGELVKYSQFGFLISTFGAHYDFGAFLGILMMLSVWGLRSYKSKSRLIFFALGLVFYYTLTVVYARSAYLGMLGGIFVMFLLGRSWFALVPLLETVRTFARYFGGTFNRFAYDFKFNILPPPPSATPTPTIGITPTAVSTVAPSLTNAPPGITTAPATLVPSTAPTVTPAGSSWLDVMINNWSQNINQFLQRINFDLDTSARYRIKSWQDAFVNVNYNFLWGGGYSTNGNSTDNDYLRHMAEVGIIGLAWFLLILWDFVRLAWHKYTEILESLAENYLSNFERNYYLFVMGLVVLMLIQSVFIDIFASSKIAFLFWFLMGNFAALVGNSFKKSDLA
jgi:hypothetical protein